MPIKTYLFSLHTIPWLMMCQNVSAIAALGGWGGSKRFSELVSPYYRTAFARTLIDFAKKYNLDGFDLE
jgi:GH18 family chitinase